MIQSVSKYSSIGIAPRMRRLPSDEVAWNIQRYEGAKTATERDRMRFIRNRRCCYALDYDAWKDSDAGSLIESGREPKTYPLHQKYVRGIAGNYIINSYDPKFIDRDDDSKDQQSTVYKYSRIRYADKEHLNYDASRNKCILDGVIGGGVEEMVIVRTPEERRGRVGFVPGDFSSWMFDPSVATHRISRDAKEAWKTHYMQAQEILDVWPWMAGEVKDKIIALKKLDEGVSTSFEEVDFHTPELDLGQLHDTYRVVEYLHFEYEKKTTIHYPGHDGPLPETGEELGSEADFVALQTYAAAKGLILDPEKLYISEEKVPVLYCTVLMPDIAVVLDNRKDERQLNGHLPVYVWAYMMESGKCIGVIDYTYYAADDFNKREAQKTKIITQTMPFKTWIHEMIANDGNGVNTNKLKEIVADMNDVSKPLVIPENIPPQMVQNLMGLFAGAQLPQYIMQDEQFKMQLMDTLANWNNALGGQSDKTNESGIHYGRKVLEGLINHTVSTETLAQHEKDKAEDGLIMGIQLYGGRTKEEKIANYNRSVNGSDGSETTINIYKGTDENGDDIVENDIGKLRRVDVIITRSKENDFQKSAKMETDSEMLKSMGPPNEFNFTAVAGIMSDYLRSQPAEDDAQRKIFNQAADNVWELAEATHRLKMKQILDQLSAPPPGQQPGQGVGGQPQGGGGGGKGSLPPPQHPGAAPGRPPIQNQSGVPQAPGREPAPASNTSAPQVPQRG